MITSLAGCFCGRYSLTTTLGLVFHEHLCSKHRFRHFQIHLIILAAFSPVFKDEETASEGSLPQVRHPGSDKADSNAGSPTLKPPELNTVCLGGWEVNSWPRQLFSVSFKFSKEKNHTPKVPYFFPFLVLWVKVEHMGGTQCRAN